MKGAYIARLDLDDPAIVGVANKISAQANAMRKWFLDIDVYYKSANCLMCNGRAIDRYREGAISRKYFHYVRFYSEIVRLGRQYDFLYIRYQKSDPVFLYLLLKLKYRKRKMPILIELPSYPYKGEYKAIKDKVLGFVDFTTRWMLRYLVNYVVTYSREMEIFGIKTIRTDNGVDVRRVDLLPLPPIIDSVRLVGLANLSYWHGYDRVIDGLSRYYKTAHGCIVYFDVIGCGRELDSLKAATKIAGLDEYVRFLGPHRGANLRRELMHSHIGVSSIGLHRLTMDSSTLKSAEFCAAGMPFITGRRDRSMPADLPFLYYVSDDDCPVDINGVLNFYFSLRETRPNFPKAMREFAEMRLTWEEKMFPINLTIHRLLGEVG